MLAQTCPPMINHLTSTQVVVPGIPLIINACIACLPLLLLQLGHKIDEKSTKIRRLEERCDHLQKLKDNLHEQAQEYLQKWGVK